ncbi:MAG: hypothetical protein ACE5L6_06505 [Candidatus Bathyarchaeia archaeon]
MKKTSSFESRRVPRRATVRLATTAVMAALIAVTTVLAIPMPPPLSTITLAPIAIFVVGILMGSIPALVSSAIGSGLGFLAGASIGTINVPPGFFSVFLVGIIVARGPMGFTVGLLRKVDEVAAMAMGVLVETAIFFIMDLYLFGFSVALITLGTLIDLVFVSAAYVSLKGIRKMLNVAYLA